MLSTKTTLSSGKKLLGIDYIKFDRIDLLLATKNLEFRGSNNELYTQHQYYFDI